MPSAAAQDILQAILERRAAEKRREMAVQTAQPPAVLPFSNRIAGAFDASQPVRQVDELSAPITLPFAARNQLGDWGPRMPNVLKTIADPRTSPFGPAAVARLFMDPAGEVGRQVETGEQLAKPFTQFNDPSVDPVKQGADLALTVMGGSSVVPAEANSLRMGIKAYHGSPHDFERFDASKIGTGEGAQAYGHGLYFAEKEAVAQDYKKALSAKFSSINRAKLTKEAAADLGASSKYLPDAILRHLEDGVPIDQIESKMIGDPLMRGRPPEDIPRAIEYVKSKFPEHAGVKGKMYEVDIAADPEHFLDWDKPLTQQSEKVREALWNAGLRQQAPNAKASDAYQTWADKAAPISQGSASRQMAASEQLREAGIPGIRYLDQGSRGTGTGTSNYVIFDDKLISILKKYGLPISAAGLAALSQLHPEEAQAGQQQNSLPRY